MEPLLQKWETPCRGSRRSKKALYHAAAATLSNQVVALLASGYEMLEACGFDTENARRASAALVRGNVENVIASGCVQALTGPIERGDLVTVKSTCRSFLRRGKRCIWLWQGSRSGSRKEKIRTGIIQTWNVCWRMKREGDKTMKNTVVTFKGSKGKGRKTHHAHCL